MILTTTFVCFCLASAFNYFRTRRQRSLIKNLKGPFTWPLMGAMQKLLFLTPKNFFQRSTEYLSKYGLLSRCWVFHRLFMPLADLELSRQLLDSDTHLETGYELMRDWLGGGVLMCQSDQWQQRHALISGLFDKGNLEQLMDLSRQQADQLQQKLLEKADRKVFDIWETVSPVVLDLIVTITCGAKPSEEYSKNLEDLSEIYRKRFLSLQSANRFNYWLSSPFMRKRQNRLIKRLNEAHKNLMASHQRQKQLKIADGLDMHQLGPIATKNYECLLEILLESKDTQLTTAEICGEINTCNYLGYLLCSSALCFCLVAIARNPSVQQKCLEELRLAQIKDQDQGWHLDKLTYLEAVLQETMRLYPPQVIVGRQLKKDFAYTHSIVGDGDLPFGSEIYINLYELQRNENRYPKANHFEAERFVDSPPELLSFSLGPRCCPARKFSMQLLKTLLAPILANFELLPYGDEVRLDLRLVMGSSNGFQLALKPRESDGNAT